MAIGLTAYCQNDDEQDLLLDRLKSHKIAYISEKLELSSAEAEVFWPVYNSFAAAKKNINLQRQQLQRSLQLQPTATDQEKTRLADQFIALREEEALVEKEFHAKFKKVLPIDKVIRLYRAEQTYKTELLNQIRERRQAARP